MGRLTESSVGARTFAQLPKRNLRFVCKVFCRFFRIFSYARFFSRGRRSAATLLMIGLAAFASRRRRRRRRLRRLPGLPRLPRSAFVLFPSDSGSSPNQPHPTITRSFSQQTSRASTNWLYRSVTRPTSQPGRYNYSLPMSILTHWNS